MGGTSADVAVIEGEPRYSTENHVGDFPVIMPAIDVTSIGAGGGSIVWTDSNGVLKVGPMSAGAKPGPACYGLGGERATVTDAYVCLGIVDPKRFLGGTIIILPALAEAAVRRIGASLGLDTLEAAESILPRRHFADVRGPGAVCSRARASATRISPCLPSVAAGPTHGFLLAREVGIGASSFRYIPAFCAPPGRWPPTSPRLHPHHSYDDEAQGRGAGSSARCGAWRRSQRGRRLARRPKDAVSRAARHLVRGHPLPWPILRPHHPARCRCPRRCERQRFAVPLHANFSAGLRLQDDAATIEILDVRATAVGDDTKTEDREAETDGEGAREATVGTAAHVPR